MADMSAAAAAAAASSHSIAAALGAVRAKVPAATVRLVAVSKTKPAAAVLEAYQAGQRVFGENYVQELEEKARQLPSDIQWHFIGHLQSNKVRQLVEIPNLAAVESVDRLKIAAALQRACESIGRASLPVYIEVNTSGEESKSGCAPGETDELVRRIRETCPSLRVAGLMTIGSPHPEPPERDFHLLREMRDRCASLVDHALELSMGMSNDFELAIRCGSSSVRVGSAIFGHRDYAAAPTAGAV